MWCCQDLRRGRGVEPPRPHRKRRPPGPELATVLKALEAVSGEIVLERLIDTLLRLAIEHAGAERGVLLISEAAGLVIRAEATVSAGAVTVRMCDAPAG